MQHRYHFKHLDHHYEVTGEYRQLPAHLDGKFLVKMLPPAGSSGKLHPLSLAAIRKLAKRRLSPTMNTTWCSNWGVPIPA